MVATRNKAYLPGQKTDHDFIKLIFCSFSGPSFSESNSLDRSDMYMLLTHIYIVFSVKQ